MGTRKILLLSILLFLCILAIPVTALEDRLRATGFEPDSIHFTSNLDDNIDLFSGNLVISQIDISLPGRNGLDVFVKRVYNSKIWDHWLSDTVHADYLDKGTSDSGFGLGWSFYFARISPHSDPFNCWNGQESPNADYKTVFAYEPYVWLGDGTKREIIMTADCSDFDKMEAITSDFSKNEEPCGKPQGINIHIPTTTAGTLWQATGNPQVEIRKAELYDCWEYENAVNFSYYVPWGVWYIPGTYNIWAQEVLTTRSGLRYYFNHLSGGYNHVTKIEDTNGNYITIQYYGQPKEYYHSATPPTNLNDYYGGTANPTPYIYKIIDTIGREIYFHVPADIVNSYGWPNNYKPAYDYITYKDSNGDTIKIAFGYEDTSINISGQWIDSGYLVNVSFYKNGVLLRPPTKFEYYSNTGELKKIIYSTGGIVSYEYDVGLYPHHSADCWPAEGGESNEYVKVVKKRTVKTSTSDPGVEWNYDYYGPNPPDNYIENSFTSPDGTTTTIRFASACPQHGIAHAKAGRAINKTVTDSGGNLLFEELNSYSHRYAGRFLRFAPGNQEAPRAVVFLQSKAVRKQGTGDWILTVYRHQDSSSAYSNYNPNDGSWRDEPWDYDDYLNNRYKRELGYVTNAELHLPAGIASYAPREWISYDSNVDLNDDRIIYKEYLHASDPRYENDNILNLISQLRILDATGDQRSKTVYLYDQSDLDPCHPTQHTYPFPFMRGNPTEIQRWNDMGDDAVTKYKYDLCGNMKTKREMIDTTTEVVTNYDYGCQQAYQTKVSKEVGGYTIDTFYDYYFDTGLLKSVKDANDDLTSYEYDSFGRITKIFKPGDAWLSPSLHIVYDDWSRKIMVQSKMEG